MAVPQELASFQVANQMTRGIDVTEKQSGIKCISFLHGYMLIFYTLSANMRL